MNPIIFIFYLRQCNYAQINTQIIFFNCQYIIIDLRIEILEFLYQRKGGEGGGEK